MGEYALGQPVSRFEDPRLIQGGGRYVDDLALPGMVHGVVLRSKHAHAKILKIDTARAKAAPGVLAVLTHADWKNSGFGSLPVPTVESARSCRTAASPAAPPAAVPAADRRAPPAMRFSGMAGGQ